MIYDNWKIKPEHITREFINQRPLSKSSLAEFQKSPIHYVNYLNEKKDSSGFLIGSLVDCLVLEPEKFEERYFIYGKPDLRTKAGKEKQQNALLQAGERTLITDVDFQTAQYCKMSLMDHNEARTLIENRFDVQKKLSWVDRKTKLPLIGYQDFRSKAWESDLLVDLKTSKSADPDEFNKAIANFGYDLQNAAYRAYYKKRFEFPDFVFLVVENSDPYAVSLIYCDNKFNEKADEAFFGALTAFEKALEPFEDFSNHFHMGYEFRNLVTMPYFSANMPALKKNHYIGFDE
jgi:hypothetical protein